MTAPVSLPHRGFLSGRNSLRAIGCTGLSEEKDRGDARYGPHDHPIQFLVRSTDGGDEIRNTVNASMGPASPADFDQGSQSQTEGLLNVGFIMLPDRGPNCTPISTDLVRFFPRHLGDGVDFHLPNLKLFR